MSDAPVLVTNIISVAFSGSTWLNLMLGSRPDSFSVGELKLMYRNQGVKCSLDGDDCPIWSQFDPASGENPYLQLHRLTGKRHLVINNSRRLNAQLNVPGVESRYLFLVRDGRAATASYLRKHPESSIWRGARWWARGIRRRRQFFRSIDPARYRFVSYEELTANPSGCLQGICEFLGIEFLPEMLRYSEWNHHFIGGNPGTLVSMADAQQRNIHAESFRDRGIDPHSDVWSGNKFNRFGGGNFVDNRWKRELTDNQLRVFALLAGRQQRAMGYGPIMDRGLGNVSLQPIRGVAGPVVIAK